MENPLIIDELSEEELNAYYETDEFIADRGYLLLSTEGCGMNSILIVNTEDACSYGTVWFYDLADDCGILPLFHPKSNRPFFFLDWLEYWVDFTLEHDIDQYFSYGKLAVLR